MSALAFGPFRLDQKTATLTREGVMVALSPRLAQVLACLADARGGLVTRELLLDRFWPDVIVTDNTLTRAIADIRKVLDDDPAAPTYIQTLARRGYRFIATVVDDASDPGAAAGAVPIGQPLAGLEPFIAWERGRAALESLDVDALPGAAEAFSRAVEGAPSYAAAHAGLANAHVFRFESTRVDNTPDLAALTSAVAAARRATELDATLGEAWAALGHALAGEGQVEEARAALRQALVVEPRNWRHHYRMAVATWGEERLRSVERAEALLPGFPGTQTLAAMVWLARQAYGAAADAAARGADAQAAQTDHGLYPANGLRWMRGLTAAATGDLASAMDDFHAEATSSSAGHSVYARECAVLAHESFGFALIAKGDAPDARGMFAAAEARSPGHARAVLGLAVADGPAADAATRVASACETLAASGKHAERLLVLAAAHAWAGRADEGLTLAEQAIDTPRPDTTGWSLPAEPMFAPLRSAAGYARLAAHLASRAS